MLQLQPKLTAWQQKNFQLILVANDGAEDLQAFFEQHPMPIKVLLDPQGKVFEQYKIQYMPSCFLINETGVIDSRLVGWNDNHLKDMERWISK